MPQIKLTRRELLDLNAGFRMVGKLSGLQFAYTIARNSDLLNSEFRAIQRAAKADDAYVTFDKERLELAKSYAVKENGVAKTYVENNVEKYVISDNEKFEDELNKLKTKHKKAVEARAQQEKKLEEFLDEEIEVTLYTLKFADLPKDITPEQLGAISIILAKEEPETKKSKK